MLNIIIGALIALIGVGFGAFMNHLWGEKSREKRLLLGLQEELHLNRDLLENYLKELPSFSARFYSDSYLSIRNNGALLRLHKETREKLTDLYIALRELSEFNFAQSLGLHSVKGEDAKQLKEYCESLLKGIDEVLESLSKSGTTKA